MTASFLLLLFFTQNNIKIILCIICFYIYGIFSLLSYYSCNNFSNINKCKVISNYGSYATAICRGKKIKVTGFKGKVNYTYLLYGKVIKNNDIEKGIVGRIEPSSYNEVKINFDYKLEEFKNNLYKKFCNSCGSTYTNEIMALCFGDTSYIDSSLKDKYTRLGIIHIISVSGFHLALLFKILEGVIGVYPSLGISFIYVIFTGNSPPAVRAFIAIFVLKISKKVFKDYNSICALSLGAVLTLWFKPYLITDIGFNLTYLCTLSILLYGKKTEKLLFLLPKKIRESLSITLSSQILAIPYVFANLHSFSLGFILSNLVLVPFYSIIVVLGNMALLLSKFNYLFI